MFGVFESRGRSLRRAVALAAAAALLNLSGAARASHAPSRAAAGQVTAAEGLTVDGSPAVSGQTFFDGSAFHTGEGSAASLALGNLARVQLSAETALRLNFDAESFGVALGAGAARVSVPQGVAASLSTADASVLSDAAAGPALFSVRVSEEGTRLSVESGRVEMRAGGRSLTAVAGQTLYASGGSAPQAAPPQGNGLSGKKKAGIFLGLAVALAAIIIIVAGQDEEVETPPEIPCPIPAVSPIFPLPPGC
jgi:ferric-dicitrate binding protein FerR (iron transport regulator)